MIATVSFYRGRVKAFETAPLKIADGLNARSKAVPVTSTFPLEKLQPGRCTCRMDVIGRSLQKFQLCRWTMVLLPWDRHSCACRANRYLGRRSRRSRLGFWLQNPDGQRRPEAGQNRAGYAL